MRKIYLGCPYSHSDSFVRQQRAYTVSLAAGLLLCRGYLVYSPITHGHALATINTLPGDWQFWQAHCASFLTDWADALFVLALDGWETSVGLAAELELAHEIGLEIIFLDGPEAGFGFFQEPNHKENPVA